MTGWHYPVQTVSYHLLQRLGLVVSHVRSSLALQCIFLLPQICHIRYFFLFICTMEKSATLYAVTTS